MGPDDFDRALLRLSCESPALGNALIAVESCLERESYDEALEALTRILRDDSTLPPAWEFLVHFYLGQALFRREAARKPRMRKIDEAIMHLGISIEHEADFMDARLMRGLAYMLKARMGESPLPLWRAAQEDFKPVMDRGSGSQQRFARERSNSIDEAMSHFQSR